MKATGLRSLALNWMVWLPTTLLVILFLVLIPRHEPWFDEAQAWLLARDSSHLDLLLNRLRYEGHPFLWYFVLKFFVGLGFGYSALNWISAGLAVGGAIWFLKEAPLPRLFRVLFPFSYFLFFQYGVVARSYSLFPLLFFGVCHYYPTRQQRPWPYTICLMLIAQVSVHGAIVAGCWWLLFLFENRKDLLSFRNWNQSAHAKSALGFIVGGAFLAFQLAPPADLIRPDFFIKQTSLIFKMVYTLWNGPLTELWPASLLVFGVSLYWFYRRGVLAFYLFPWICLYSFFGIFYGKAWHEGVGFCLWLAATWLSYLENKKVAVATEPAYRLMNGAVAVLLGFHLYWSCIAFKNDYQFPNSGSRELAHFIGEHGLEKNSIVATEFFSPVTLPYFKDNIFMNFNKGKRPSFFWWSLNYSFNDSAEYIQQSKPQLLVLGVKFQENDRIQQPAGYTFVKWFPGFLFLKDRILEKESFALFRRDDFVIP